MATRIEKLPSERINQASPMTFRGAAQRIWRLTDLSEDRILKAALGLVAAFTIAVVWFFLAIGDLISYFLPERLQLITIRAQGKSTRGARAEALRHKELIEELRAVRVALERSNPDVAPTEELPILGADPYR